MLSRKFVSRNIIDTLKRYNIKHVFGYPGGAILPIIDNFYKNKSIKFITPKTEIGASFMAEGYAKMLENKKPGVVLSTSGPGATNLVTSLQNALMDGTPLIALTGQVSTSSLGKDTFQESNIIEITRMCTKWNKLLTKTDDIEHVLDELYNLSLTGRPGPVLLDIPKDLMNCPVQQRKVIITSPTFYKQALASTQQKLELEHTVLDKIKNAKTPVIIAGQGVLNTDTIHDFRNFVRTAVIPVTTTLLGLGAENELDMYSIEMMGMHGNYTANKIVQMADLILVLGARLDDRVTGNVVKFGKLAESIVHIDIRDNNKHRTVQNTHFIKSSVFAALQQLKKVTISQQTRHNRVKWIDKIQRVKQKHDFKINKYKTVLGGSEILSDINRIIQKDKDKKYCIVTDVGAHQMWAAQYIKYDFPRIKYITSGGLGSMGYGLPASIGAKLANDTYNVICIVGDSGFNMSMQELLTMSDYNIDVKIFIMNNGYQQMVRMWQDYFYNKRYIAVKNNNPRYDNVAKSLGITGYRFEKKNYNVKQLEKIINSQGSIVVDCIINPDEYVYPIVLPGKGISEMKIERK